MKADTINCKSIEEAVELYNKNPNKNIRFSIPSIPNQHNKSSSNNESLNTQNLQELSSVIGDLKGILTSTNNNTNNSYEEALYRINLLKHVIENMDGNKLFRILENQNEAIFQYLFKFTCVGSKWDINSEVNNGRGPVDFTISKGSIDKTVVEFKLAKNSKLEQNLQNQVDVYKRANNTDKAVTAILYFDEKEYAKLQQVLKELNLENDKDIILIDARRKISASNVK